MTADTTPRIDINCDMGESFGAYTMGNDREIMPYISSANIACGYHAGDPSIMARTVQLALEYNVAIGAHPGFPDLHGFGRRNMSFNPEEIKALVLYQIGALSAITKAQGGSLHHVKPHGALYNMAAREQQLARAIAEAVHQFDPGLVLYGLSGSYLVSEAKKMRLATASEVFADRTYQSDGQLTSRSQPGALIESENQCLDQIMQMVLKQRVNTVDGQQVAMQPDTLCLHGDGEHAVHFARNIRYFLDQQNIRVQAINLQSISVDS